MFCRAFEAAIGDHRPSHEEKNRLVLVEIFGVASASLLWPARRAGCAEPPV
jgi:hypothetical protein